MIRRLPIATQVMLLVSLATLLASGAMVGITLGGPPPRQPPHSINDISRALSGGRPLAPGARLSTSATPPRPDPDLRADPALAARIARAAGVPAADVRAFLAQPLPPEATAIRGRYQVALRRAEGGWRVIDSGFDPDFNRWRKVTFGAIALVLAVILLLAWLLARRIAGPVEKLGAAAEAARPGDRWTLQPPEGPPEIRAAAISLGNLHERTRAHAEERMTTLAAIAHDIGTPVARLAFWLEKLPEEARTLAMADVEIIRRLLVDSLTLARSWSGPLETVAMDELCRRFVQRESALGRAVVLVRADQVTVHGDALSLERMVQNLVDNALRYGKTARLALTARDGEAVLAVADEGPGFPDIPQSELLKPFVRGDSSRNSASGGSGLGLAIVSQIIERHGGSIVLNNMAGGAVAEIALPAVRSSVAHTPVGGPVITR